MSKAPNPKGLPTPKWQSRATDFYPLSNPPSASSKNADTSSPPTSTNKRPFSAIDSGSDSDSSDHTTTSTSKDKAVAAPETQTKKRRGKSSDGWRKEMGAKYGYELGPAPQNKGKGCYKCSVCGKVLTNTNTEKELRMPLITATKTRRTFGRWPS